MKVSELLSKMWVTTHIIFIKKSKYNESYRDFLGIRQYKMLCDWWGTVSDYVNIDYCPVRPDKEVVSYGDAGGYIVIVIKD